MLAFAALAAVLGAKAEAETVIFVNATSKTIADPARYWNKVSFIPASNAQQKYTLKDKDTNTTTVVAWVLEPGAEKSGNALKAGCTGEASEFSKLNKDCAGEEPYAAEEGYNNTRRPAMRMRLTGLDPAKYYTFTFYGSRTEESGKTFKTVFSATGTSSGSATLNTSGNSTKVAKVNSILPTPDGFVEISVRGADDSTNKFGYFQGLKIESFSRRQLPFVREFFVDACNQPAADPDRVWNAVAFNKVSASPSALVDSLGITSDIKLAVTTKMGGPNNFATATFTGDAAEFNAARSKDNNNLYNVKTSAPCSEATVSGLDPAKLYAVTFVASRMNGQGKFTGTYSIIGETSASAKLDANNNKSNVAAVTAVAPKEDGTLGLRIEAAADNTSTYYCLVALKITEYWSSEDDLRWASAKATDGGSVAVTVSGEASESAGWFPVGTTLTATATPDAGWKFVAWTSDWTDTPVKTATIEIPVTAGKAANWTAVFEKDEAYKTRVAYFDAIGTPASDTKTWNMIGSQLLVHNGKLEDIRSSSGGRTPLVITVDQEFYGSSNANASKNARGDAAPFKAASSADGKTLYTYTPADTQVSFVISGLNPARLYTLKFFASRTAAGAAKYPALYRAVGANEVQKRFDAANNETALVVLANLRPTPEGTIRFEQGTAPNSTNYFTYLAAFSIEGDIKIPGQGLIIVVE